MNILRISRRAWIAGLTTLTGCSPWPVNVSVRNLSSSDITVGIRGYPANLTVAPAKSGMLVEWFYSGVFAPPSDWVPESFPGLDIELDGEHHIVTREEFVRDLVFRRNFRIYKFRGND